jgi:MFS family permease
MIRQLGSFIKNKSTRAVGIIFASNGFVFGAWASFIPYIKEKFHLDEAQLGLLLLFMPFGVFLSNPVSVILIRHWGAVKTAMVFAVMTGLAFILPVAGFWIPFVAFGLVISGAAFGITNVAMNTCASALEDTTRRGLISTCHGMWSVGAMLGALLSGLSLIPFQDCCSQFLKPQVMYVGLQGLIVLFIIWWIRNDLDILKKLHIPPDQTPRISLKMMKPVKELWVIISICLCTYLIEGAITDWSSVFLREVIFSSETMAGWGFAVFAFFMALGRFFGDGLIARYGNMRVLRAGGIFALVGIVVIIVSTTYLMAMPGFMLAGAGISVASPILYQASAKVKGLAPGIGLATMNTFAMAAFLTGPVLIGFIAKLSNLRIAFMFVGLIAILWVIQTTKVIYTKK